MGADSSGAADADGASDGSGATGEPSDGPGTAEATVGFKDEPVGSASTAIPVPALDGPDEPRWGVVVVCGVLGTLGFGASLVVSLMPSVEPLYAQAGLAASSLLVAAWVYFFVGSVRAHIEARSRDLETAIRRLEAGELPGGRTDELVEQLRRQRALTEQLLDELPEQQDNLEVLIETLPAQREALKEVVQEQKRRLEEIEQQF